MVESKKVEFPGATGAMLAARLDLPATPRAFALFAHCFTCGKDIFAASRIADGSARGRHDFFCRSKTDSSGGRLRNRLRWR